MVCQNSINVNASGVVSFDSTTGVFTESALTQHDVLVAGSANSIVSVTPSTAGFVLTSNGVSSDPSFQVSSAGSITLTGDSGTASGNALTIFADTVAQNCGSSVSFDNSGTTSTFNVSDANDNTIIGKTSGNNTISGRYNTSIGSACFPVLSSGNNNCCVGKFSGFAITSGANNNLMGSSSGQSISTGGGNTCIGESSMAQGNGGGNTCIGANTGSNMSTGSGNTLLGVGAGQFYTGSESSNIVIQSTSSILGAPAGDNNVIRIGFQGSGSGEQNSCFIAGIAGVTVASSAAVLIDTTSGKLGTVVSSRRYKTNIEDIQESERIYNLNPVQFNYKANPKEVHYGLIAEEVVDVMPELVVFDKEGRPETVMYHEFTGLLLAEIKKLRARIEALEG